MKKKLSFSVGMLLFACACSTGVTRVEKPAALLNADSLKRIASDKKQHLALIEDVFERLAIDSLGANGNEAYRFMLLQGWGPSKLIGSPLAITFYKKKDSAFVSIKERRRITDTGVCEQIKKVDLALFDSIRALFNTHFWNAPVTDFNCRNLNIDADKRLYEAFDGRRHKIMTHKNCGDSLLNKSIAYNFFICSAYSAELAADLKWYRENPPCCVKTPGPPSAEAKNKIHPKK